MRLIYLLNWTLFFISTKFDLTVKFGLSGCPIYDTMAETVTVTRLRYCSCA